MARFRGRRVRASPDPTNERAPREVHVWLADDVAPPLVAVEFPSGSDSRAFLTPARARELADALRRAAGDA